MTYYLLVACRAMDLYLAVLAPDRPPGTRPPVALALRLAAVALGVAVSAIQVLPFLAYIPFSPRGEGGPSGGWEYAVSYSMPPEELLTTVLPQFNGMLENYWGRNYFKLHTEYLGAVVVALAAIGLGDRSRTRLIRGARRHRDPLPVRRIGRSHAVLPPVVRGHADDEEGPRARHGLLSSSRFRWRSTPDSAPSGC